MQRQISEIFYAQVEKLAYEFWEQRGRPLGSPEEDWFRAEQVLRHHFGISSSFPVDSAMELPFSPFMMGPFTE